MTRAWRGGARVPAIDATWILPRRFGPRARISSGPARVIRARSTWKLGTARSTGCFLSANVLAGAASLPGRRRPSLPVQWSSFQRTRASPRATPRAITGRCARASNARAAPRSLRRTEIGPPTTKCPPLMATMRHPLRPRLPLLRLRARRRWRMRTPST